MDSMNSRKATNSQWFLFLSSLTMVYSSVSFIEVKISDTVITSISFHKKLGIRLAHNNCDCREFNPKSDIYVYIYSQSLNFTVTAQSEHACNGVSTCERVLYVWSPNDIGFSIGERDHSPRQCHKTWNSHKTKNHKIWEWFLIWENLNLTQHSHNEFHRARVCQEYPFVT